MRVIIRCFHQYKKSLNFFQFFFILQQHSESINKIARPDKIYLAICGPPH